MSKSASYEKWLETGYRLFAEDGPENLTVKHLAEECQLPRTNFYYHFNDKGDFIDKIIEVHLSSTIELFNQELRTRFHTYIPDLYVILFDFKLGLQFAKQLFKNRDNLKYNRAYNAGVILPAEFILPKFKRFFKLDLPDKSVLILWTTLVDAWYSRLNFDNVTVDDMISLCYEIMDSILPLVENHSKVE